MTTWKSESDVLLDLDTLSGFSSVSKVSHPTSKAFGGSRSLPVVNQIEKNDYSDCVKLDSKYERIPSGRGQMIQQLFELKSRNRSGELHSQLRKACGRGYSNELIEAEFGLYSKFDFPSTEQSKYNEDIAESSMSPPSTHSPSLDNAISEEQLSVTADCSRVQSMPTKQNKLFACSRKGLKKRNALLNSLSNLHHVPPISNGAIVQPTENDPSIEKECNSIICGNPSTTAPFCSQINDMFLPHGSECSKINSGKSKNTIVNGNHNVNILSNDMIRPTMKQTPKISDYFPSDGTANSECSQFIDSADRNSCVLRDSHSDDRSGFNFTSEDFPPL